MRWLNAKLSIALPQEEYEKIKKHPEVKWGAVARQAVLQYLAEYENFLESNKPKQSSENEKLLSALHEP